MSEEEEAAAAAAAARTGVESIGRRRDGGRAEARVAAAGRAWEFRRDVVSGAVMGGAVHTVVAPIERVKLLLQTQDGNAALLGRARRFRGFFDCVARTVRDEGVLSLWRGNGTAVIRYYPSVALNFSLKVPPLPEPANPCRAFYSFRPGAPGSCISSSSCAAAMGH
jgi:solute carrier family 25 (mitochondrial adenine nucleotide translocator), member 4/5/6/31